MTGKILNGNPTNLLILIIPVAIGIVLLYKAWPALLLIFLLSVAWKMWENYQWNQWTQQVNPFFNQLIVENQGCLTPVDLSLKANLTGRAAQRFLARKAEEYGAQQKVYPDKGTVYYFLTASALGSIFDDSEPLSEEEIETLLPRKTSIIEVEPPSSPVATNTIIEVELPSSPVATNTIIEVESPSSPVATNAIAQLAELKEARQQIDNPWEQPLPEVEETIPEEIQPESPVAAAEIPETASSETPVSIPGKALIQSDLAKRLDLNPSTVGRRKADLDFPEWSQSRDPDGIAWKYVPKTKMFVPVDLT